MINITVMQIACMATEIPVAKKTGRGERDGETRGWCECCGKRVLCRAGLPNTRLTTNTLEAQWTHAARGGRVCSHRLPSQEEVRKAMP